MIEIDEKNSEYMSLRKELDYCPQLVAAAAITQYFITAVFFWMACEGVHLYYRHGQMNFIF